MCYVWFFVLVWIRNFKYINEWIEVGMDGGIIGDGERKKGYGVFSFGMWVSKNGR